MDSDPRLTAPQGREGETQTYRRPPRDWTRLVRFVTSSPRVLLGFCPAFIFDGHDYDPHVPIEATRGSFAPRTLELVRARMAVEGKSPRKLSLHALLPAAVGVLAGLIRFHSLRLGLLTGGICEMAYWVFAGIFTLVAYHGRSVLREWRTITIDEDGIGIAMGKRTSFSPWTDFEKYFPLRAGRVLLFDASQRLLWIPDRAFVDPRRIEPINELIQQHVACGRWKHGPSEGTSRPSGRQHHGWSIESGDFGNGGQSSNVPDAVEVERSSKVEDHFLPLVGFTAPDSEFGLMRSSSVKNVKGALTVDSMAIVGGLFFMCMGGLIAVAGVHNPGSTDNAGNPALGSVFVALGLLGILAGLLLGILSISFWLADYVRNGRTPSGPSRRI